MVGRGMGCGGFGVLGFGVDRDGFSCFRWVEVGRLLEGLCGH